ncbi:MAG: hypothetical protein QF464_15870, partial [Myxococcota bacterium]|nr:hypothetical protein [Myxococcota bacterium]
MEHRPNSGGFGARFDEAVQRWGIVVTLAIGALVVFAGLGRSGLWDPWEVDRADLGRRLSAPAQIAAAVSGAGGIHAPLEAVSTELGIVARVASAPGSGGKAGPAAVRTVRETLSRARTSLLTAILFERELLTPDDAADAV